jgi:hypothetical protein
MTLLFRIETIFNFSWSRAARKSSYWGRDVDPYGAYLRAPSLHGFFIGRIRITRVGIFFEKDYGQFVKNITDL